MMGGQVSEITKSRQSCRRCKTSSQVIHMQWQDDCGPTIEYDDHVCLECGLYTTGGGCSLCEESLQEYRMEYGHLVGRYKGQKTEDPKRFFNLLWASLPSGWDIDVVDRINPRYLKVRFSNKRSGTEFDHRFDLLAAHRHRDSDWIQRQAAAVLRKKGAA